MRNAERSRSVSPRAVRSLNVLKFKTRADLLSFSQRYPGALAAQFIAAVVDKLEVTPLKNERQL